MKVRKDWLEYFDYYKTALGITFLVAGSLLTPCLCAPTPDPWWFSSCVTPTERIRHGRSADQELVRSQLRTFVGKLNINISKDLNILYKEVNKTKTQFKGKLPWLRLKKMLKKMKEPSARLGEFHQSLQLFAGTLDVLSKIRINTRATRFRVEDRQKIYNYASEYLKLLLCEVEFTLQQTDEEIPKGIHLKKMGIHRLPKSMDLTGVYLLDLNFFKKMKTFFTRSQQFFRIKKNRKLNSKSEMKKPKRT